MISVVLYGRNDTYGYNLHKRAAISLNCIAEILTAPGDEIIFVDYNTPDDFPTFPEAIQDTLTARAKALLRILRVRPKQHERFRDRTHLLALEPVARNVGVRRSNPENRWILSTNTDMVFVPRRDRSLSEIVAELPDAYYHLPRFEVPETLWESLDRLDPAGTIRAMAHWGWAFHLNEIVYASDPAVKYDGPGDFQLILRSDLWRIDGFHESMLLGWHVDSNIAKRLSLLPRETGSLVGDLFGYHCDHTRQVTPAHRTRARQNDWRLFVDGVQSPEIPEQASTWGLAGEQVEELQIDTTSRCYLTGLRSLIDAPLAEPTELRYTPATYNRIDYPIEHVLPFLLDIFAGYPRETILGWIGTKEALLERFAEFWRQAGFFNAILVAPEASVLSNLPPGCVRASVEELGERCDVFVFDWGRPESRRGSDWDCEADVAIRSVLRSFRCVVTLERRRLESGSATPRRFIGVNAAHNVIERRLTDHVDVVRTPISTRIRQGYINRRRLPIDVFPELQAGDAGLHTGDGIQAVRGVDGLVFYGGYIDLFAGSYRLTLDFDAARAMDENDGLVLAVFCSSFLLEQVAIAPGDVARGRVSCAFTVPIELEHELDWTEVEFHLRTFGLSDVVVRAATLEEIEAPETVTASVDLEVTDLLSLGSAGVRVRVPDEAYGKSGRRWALQAKAGVAGFVAYGPYIRLRPGFYEAIFTCSVHKLSEAGRLALQIVAGGGKRIVARQSFVPYATGRYDCVLGFAITESSTEALEFIMFSQGTLECTLLDVRVRADPSASPERIATLQTGALVSESEAMLTVSNGSYRLSARFEDDEPAMSEALLIVSTDSYLCGYRLMRTDRNGSEASGAIEFATPALPSGGVPSEIELRVQSVAGQPILPFQAELERIASVSEAEAGTELALLPLLSVGPAGRVERHGAELTIHAKAGVEGFVAHGPYIRLRPGWYEALFTCAVHKLGRDGRLELQVVAGGGTRVMARERFAPRAVGRCECVLGFVIPEGSTETLECMVFSPGTHEFTLLDVRIREDPSASPERVAAVRVGALVSESSATLAVPNGSYRLSARFEGEEAVSSEALLIVSADSYLCGYRLLRGGGAFAVAFPTPALPSGGEWSEIGLRVQGVEGQPILPFHAEFERIASVSEAEAGTELALLPLLSVGPAGRVERHGAEVALRAKAGVEGFVAYGPYIHLRPGFYEALFSCVVHKLGRGGRLELQVVADGGKRIVARQSFVPNATGRCDCVLGFPITESSTDTLEFTVWSDGDAAFSLLGLHVRRADLQAFNWVRALTVGPAGTRDSSLGIWAKRGVQGYVAYGPYVLLSPGAYEALFRFETERPLKPAEIALDIVADSGERVLAQAQLRPPETGWFGAWLTPRRENLEVLLPFEVPATNGTSGAEGIEFRVWSPGTLRFCFRDLRLRPLSSVQAPTGEVTAPSP
ncbi:MAG TPA: hypothetical protein VKY65_03210 [Alphaproteobacteria bacterium]|nr:hypothetical protein [Alphaproteobacteria bacterium]